MKNLLLGSAVLILFSLSILIFQFSCKKDVSARSLNSNENSDVVTANCNIRGTYAGTSRSVSGATSTLAYSLRVNNFAIGSGYLGGPAVTFGGYRHTCDSVFLSVHYADNNSYYYLKGGFQNEHTTINGVFYNITLPSDSGTFVMTKQ